jgi:hypothetical protein
MKLEKIFEQVSLFLPKYLTPSQLAEQVWTELQPA